MRKGLKGIGITVMWMVLFFFLPMTAYATDLTETMDFITNVSLTDREGDPLGSNIAKNADLLLTYEFAIPDDATVEPLDTYSLPIPDEIALTPGPAFDITDSVNGGTIATVSYSGHGLLLTFTDHAKDYSDINGSFYMELAFDETEIGMDDPTTIIFDVGGTTEPTQINIDFDQPPVPTTSVQKSGDYDAATGEIEWTITVNSEAVEVLDGVLTDTIPAGLTFVPGSVTIGGEAADPGNYSYVDPTLTYTFPTNFSSEQVVIFKTTVDESEYIFANSHGETVTESNTASLTHNGGIVTASNTADVNIPIEYIDKTGSYNAATKQIDWTIIVNQMGVTIPDAVLTDSLQVGLALDTSSVKIDGGSVGIGDVGVSYVDPLITIDFGAIYVAKNNSHKLEFSTDVDPSVFESNASPTYSNEATLVGTNVPVNASATAGPIAVSSSVISKTGAGYDPETAEITWQILVNSNEISIESPVITDLIPKGQEYVAASAIISGGAPGAFSFDGTDPDVLHTGTLTYTFGATITGSYTIEYKTTVTDPNIYATNQTNVTYSNEATLTSSNLSPSSSSDTGTQRIDSEVIEKTGQGYDYVTREIEWRIQVNQNEMDLDTVVISDMIDVGQEYVDGSFSISSVSGVQTGTFSNLAPTWTYRFDGSITEEYIITFKTRVTELTVFETNGTKTFSNTAGIASNLVPTAVLNIGTQNVNNTIIGKTGDYTTGNTYIDWMITVNTNDIPLSDGKITDQLQEGLALDTNSVVLYHASVDSAGTVIQGTEVGPLTSANVIYNADTRLFEFNIPTPISGGYILKFRTDITDKSQSPFSNEASFNGSGTLNNGSESPLTVAWSGSGSSATGSAGSMKIIKVDRDNHSTLLQGAVFELEDRYGNVVQIVTTDVNGEALFERLRYNVDYTVREVTAPTDYERSSEEYTFQIDSGLVDKNLSYTFENVSAATAEAERAAEEAARKAAEDSKPKTLTIEVVSVDEDDNPLEGSTFILVDENGNEVAKATSGPDGVARFENVPTGNYTVKETIAPDKYLINAEIIVVNTSESGVVKGVFRHTRNLNSPQTGDNIKVYFWMLGLSFWALLMIFLFPILKRKILYIKNHTRD